MFFAFDSISIGPNRYLDANVAVDWIASHCERAERSENKTTENKTNRDLLVVHIFDNTIEFDTHSTRQTLLTKSCFYGLLFPTQPKKLITHQLLKSCKVDVGFIGPGLFIEERSSYVGDIDIWFVRSQFTDVFQ